MKSAMTNYIGFATIINMLKLWIAPDIWHDKTLFAEIKDVIQKLTEPLYQLSERELFLTQELVNGLLEAIFLSFNKVDDFQKNELSLVINDITQFLSFLEADTENH